MDKTKIEEKSKGKFKELSLAKVFKCLGFHIEDELDSQKEKWEVTFVIARSYSDVEAILERANNFRGGYVIMSIKEVSMSAYVDLKVLDSEHDFDY